MSLDQFIKQEHEHMIQHLTRIIKECQENMRIDPAYYTERGSDEPSIDIRLCIDLESHGGPNWIVRIGLVDYDPYFSEYCSASCIGLDTKPEDLLTELTDSLE